LNKMAKHESHTKPIFEYNKITSHIYLGTNLCCQTHFKSSLLKKGISADISLEKEKLDHPYGVKYYLWLPVKDHHAPTQDQLELGSKFLEDLVKKKIKTYIHCKMGHSRSATLVAAYFLRTGKTVQEAINYIKKKRPQIHLTKSQEKSLNVFFKKLKPKII